MESPQNPTGQKLQWWQENTPAPRAKWYQETDEAKSVSVTSTKEVAVPSAPVELWDELEAEAIRRVEQEQLRRSQEWVVKGNYDQVVRRRTKRLAIVLGVLTAFYSVLALVSQSWIPIFAILGVALFALYARQKMVQKIKKQRSMELGISPFGVSFDGPNFSGLLAWHEIRKIDRCKLNGQRFIVFHATDSSVIERLNYTAQGERMRRSGKKWGWLAKMHRLDQQAVYLPEDVLPMDAPTFLTRVATAQSAARVPAH